VGCQTQNAEEGRFLESKLYKGRGNLRRDGTRRSEKLVKQKRTNWTRQQKTGARTPQGHPGRRKGRSLTHFGPPRENRHHTPPRNSREGTDKVYPRGTRKKPSWQINPPGLARGARRTTEIGKETGLCNNKTGADKENSIKGKKTVPVEKPDNGGRRS